MAEIFEELTPGIIQANLEGAAAVCGTAAWMGRKIGGVINCATELNPFYHPDLKHLKLEMLDEMVVPPEWFDQAVLFQKHLSALNLKTVVHCRHAVNRSSIVAAALMIAWGVGPHEAINRLPRKPWGVPTIASLLSWSKTRTV